MFTIEDMITMLKNHRSKVKAMRQLEFELTQISALLTEEDIIYSLSLSVPDGETVSTGRISDRTCDAALRYKDEAGEARKTTVSALHRELTTLQLEVNRLEHYVSLLDDDLRITVSMLYFEGVSIEMLASSLALTSKGVGLRRNRAAIALAEMYNRLLGLIE